MWVVGAVLCLTAATMQWAQIVTPLGWKFDRISDSRGDPVWIVRDVRVGSPAGRAGFRRGDSMRGRDLEEFTRVLRPGGQYRIPIERQGGGQTLVLEADPGGWIYWQSDKGVRSIMSFAIAALSLVLAGVLVFVRPQDPTARWGALFMAQFATVSGSPAALEVSPEAFAPAHWLPSPLGAVAIAGLFLANLIPPVALTFLGRFPRRPFHGRVLALLWMPALAVIPLDITLFHHAYPSAAGSAMPPWMLGLAQVASAGYFLSAAVLLVRNYRRLTDANERRRTKILVIGLAIASVVGVFVSFLSTPSQPVEQIRTAHTRWLTWGLALVGFAAPIATAYAILRHRVFDVSVMVRLGLRYAAARGLLLSLVPLIGVALIGDVLFHGNQPLVAILRQRGWLYAGLALAAYVLHKRRKTWLAALDRRFFRESYDAQQILGAVVEEVRRSADFGQAAPKVIARVETALHPEFAALVLRESAGAEYRVVSSTGMAPPPLPASSKLVSLVRVLGKPVEVPPGESGWVTRQLPPEESDFVRRNRIEWLFPISVAPGATEALLLLGPKRSEEPYAKEDQDLLEAIAANLAMLLERSAPALPKAGFEECPECGTCYATGEELCTRDGVRLSRLASSRAVDGRYRLDRRLGQGGMGTVYEAFDGELERRVAVKLIRPELVAGADAAVRFKWEAKAAASFTHANVVTVYDFGVGEDGRAYTVMELLEGCTLRQEIEQVGRFEVPRALAVMRGVCAAVSAAHERGLLHRDLKPENIFLTRSGGLESAKILDFGLVKQLAGFGSGQESLATTAGVLVGTLRYMAPEQLRGGPPSPGWDLWALSIVAYEMLVGTYPFGAPQEIGQLMAPRALSPVSDHLPGARPQWQDYFNQALSPDPAKRPASAWQLFSELEKAVAGLTSSAVG
jgi:serine/threonine-protein kinase